MKSWNRIKSNNFLIKLRSWEYWPFEVIYAPAFIYWLYLSFKAKSLFFFSAANPGIETGGLIGESKIDILRKVPNQLLPKTVFVPVGKPIKEVLEAIRAAGIDFPLIAKPNVGSRGFLVQKITSISQLESALLKKPIDFLLQEFIGFPVELSVMYYRFPNAVKGAISSVTIKEYLAVNGDGHSTVLELIQKYERAKLQLNVLKVTHENIMNHIPAEDEVVELVPIGNHCRGAAFYNGNHLIDKELISTFDQISHQLEGIYFGRFDIKCASMEELKQGENFKILEINGVGAEPAHIYDPDYRLSQAIRDILKQWNTIYQISLFNRRQGAQFMSIKDAYQVLLALFNYKRLARS